MYPSPQKSSSRTPVRRSRAQSVASGGHSLLHPHDAVHRSSRLPSPAPTLSSQCDSINTANWQTFDWSLLNTPNDRIRIVKKKTIATLRQNCNQKLNELDISPFKTKSLKLLIAGIRSLIEQKWKVLVVYFDEDCEFPWLERPWSHKEWRKWDVINFLTRMAVSYYAACERAVKNDVKLCTEQADQEILELVKDLLDLGADAAADEEEIIVIKEWERLGTLLTLRCEGVVISDEGFKRDDGKNKNAADD